MDKEYSSAAAATVCTLTLAYSDAAATSDDKRCVSSAKPPTLPEILFKFPVASNNSVTNCMIC